jgi:hypothetical protein
VGPSGVVLDVAIAVDSEVETTNLSWDGLPIFTSNWVV